jgi:hypothetical protein
MHPQGIVPHLLAVNVLYLQLQGGEKGTRFFVNSFRPQFGVKKATWPVRS